MGSLGEKLIQLVKGLFFWTLRVQRSQSRCVGVVHQEHTTRLRGGKASEVEKGKLWGRKILDAELQMWEKTKNATELTALEDDDMT